MTAKDEARPDRRRFLRTLFGSGVSERVGRERIVEKYRSLLGRRTADLPFGVPENELPAPKEEIAGALKRMALSDRAGLPTSALRDAYASLAMFCSDDAIRILHEGRGDFEKENFTDEGQRRIQRAFALRNRLVKNRTALERDFDAFVKAGRRHEEPQEDSPAGDES